MQNKISTILLVLICIIVAACSNDTSSFDSAQSKSGAAANVGKTEVAVARWSGSLLNAKKSDLCSLDAVNGEKAVDGSFGVAAGQPVALEGWVSTTGLGSPNTFSVILHGTSSFAIKASTGVERVDVAQAYKTRSLMNSGYRVELAALAIPAGDYTVSLVHEEAGTKFVCPSKFKISFK